MSRSYEELKDRFTYHQPDQAKIHIHGRVRTACFDLAVTISQLVPEGREQSLALTKIEEAMFFANAGVARHGLQSPVGDEWPNVLPSE